MSFLETPRFPVDLSYGSSGGPTYSTTIAETFAGTEKRNINWVYPRHKYDASFATRTDATLYQLLSFFHVCQGRGHGFRFKDWNDYKSVSPKSTVTNVDQIIGIGTGVLTTFQLTKTYLIGATTKTRIIKKPVSGTVVISLNNVAQPTGWSVDTTTGIVTFVTAPAVDVIVRAGYEFDVPVRFDSDELSGSIESFSTGNTDIILMELK